MKQIDMRFDGVMLQEMVGTNFDKYRCDRFEYTNSVTQVVGLYINDKIYVLNNLQESVDYYGNNEDIAVFCFMECKEEQVKSAFLDTVQIDTPVKGTISAITIVNEHQQLFKEGVLMYDVWLTRGIIFHVDGRELSFIKDNVPFSEEILIRKGYELEKIVEQNNDFLEGWDDGYEPQVSREVVYFQ